MKTSEQVGDLMKALASAQPKMVVAPFDSENPHFRSKYAGLPSVRAVAGALSEVGIALVQSPEVVRRVISSEVGDVQLTEVIVTTRLQLGEQWVETSLALKPAKDDPHGVGSAITYARRYTLAAIVGMAADEDDDANHATMPDGKPTKTAKPKAKTAKPADAPPADDKAPKLASPKQQNFVKALMAQLNLTDEQKPKALAKYKIESLEKMSDVSARKIIDAMKAAVDKKKEPDLAVQDALKVLAATTADLEMPLDGEAAMIQDLYPGRSLDELAPDEIVNLAEALGNAYKREATDAS